ncbi:chloramphenicol O-acetyltransferase type A [Cyclonatronum proteinivorum]|uniref:Chloramphenicol O-acetyltransferase type A n=1 Tax=Cyclonatronum proteinivorum TaxID=1457365 RepID=A0A345UH16_9BACT|nr:CatA-like O-acetyltransferase [Cyclonatronum proteinivorum]AXI99767.1 chloramphenicol O-acetyltransferase type A [Cyclonatronum proteinivorum]
MFERIDLNTWPRRPVFELYNNYRQPDFNLTGRIEVTGLYKSCKSAGIPFSTALLYLSVQIANSIPEFRLRVTGDEVRLYDFLHCGCTELDENENLRFTYYSFEKGESLPDFAARYPRGTAASRTVTPGTSTDRDLELDLLFHTIIPWFSFTGLRHPRNETDGIGSIPRIAFGKYEADSQGRLMMPVSVEAHHGLMDGLHVCRYFNGLEDRCRG